MNDWASVKASALSTLKKYPPDTGIGRYLSTINSNPNIVTKGSCSGLPDIKKWEDGKNHGGHPYVWLAFATPNVTARYVPMLRQEGLSVWKLPDEKWPNMWYVEIPGTTNGRGGDARYGSDSGARKATPLEARRFWDTVTEILSS